MATSIHGKDQNDILTKLLFKLKFVHLDIFSNINRIPEHHVICFHHMTYHINQGKSDNVVLTKEMGVHFQINKLHSVT